jgi:hypothetical protein
MSKKCLAIGVSSVAPVDGAAEEFPYLDGAVVAAETIGQWALHSGFAAADVVVLTDKGNNRVTDVSLQDAFDKLLPANTPTEHLVLSFTGHGLTGINDDTTYWLMSDSLDQGYQIFVEELRRQLYSYRVQHLTIFSDACRAIANTRDLRSLLPRPGVRKRHLAPEVVQLARFNACQDATSAFMVRVPGAAAPGKCIFSGVLAEALWGRVPAAFDGSVVDSSSLGRGLIAAAKERATQYNLTLVPGGGAFFDKVIYYDKNAPPQPPDPDLAPWPPATVAQAATAGARAAEVEEGVFPNVFESVLVNKAIRTDILGSKFGADHPDIDTRLAFPGLPRAARPLVESVAHARRILASALLPKRQKKALSIEMTGHLKALEGLAAGKARKKKADQLRVSLQRTATRPADVKARLVVNGQVSRIWAPIPIHPLHRDSRQSQFALSELGQERLLMVEFVDGLFAPIWSYRDLICMVLRDANGVAAVGYRTPRGDDAGAGVAADAVSRLVTGNLSSEEVDKLATRLRYEKHVNPVFGAIAAYCYDVTGDQNSIRRMAAFYALNGQEIPYDIVLMGMIGNDGKQARVPAVPKDDRRSGTGLPDWLTAATPARSAHIAGRCPWLRQGWDFLSTAEGAELPLVDDLTAFRAHLTSSAFTTLNAEGGQMLAEKWQLQPSALA